MSNFKLNLPTDIPWERVCVTEDMIDPRLCDSRAPAKWQSSLAVFKYRPEEENQIYPKYNITYLKVTATLTGYQPLDQEVQGHIDWHGVDVSTIPGLTDLLNSYNPCHGAILQVTVGPKDNASNVPLSDFPFFMDFEPKKRELYELATDTKEKQSRSLESLNVTKSSGSTQSTEILDVDMGGGGFGAQASYAGTGGGFNYSAPNGQWGTKQLNSDQGLSSRSSDVAQEKRETYSFSTQISQMYHLLDSYHLGTNRVVFFIQPRPHTLEEPSGFVRGPRPVEGIQEFFMVVAQLKTQEDFCISLRLDTSHLTRIPIMDFERKSDVTSIASATAPVASKHDIPAENIVGARACFIECWDVHYQCYITQKSDTVTYPAPAGFKIENYNILVNESSHGSTNIVVTPNRKTLNINVEAHGHCCFEGSEVCVDCPDTIQEWAGSARCQVQVNLISETPTKQIGEEEVLMITTRGLCCCSSENGRKSMPEFVVGIKPVPDHLVPAKPKPSTIRFDSHSGLAALSTAAGMESMAPLASSSSSCGCSGSGATTPEAKYSIRQANELSSYIKTEALRSLNDPYAEPKKFVDTEFFAKQLERRVVQTRQGRALLNRPASKTMPRELVAAVAKHLHKEASELTVQDVLSLRSADLAKLGDSDVSGIMRLKLASLGVTFRKGGKTPEGGTTRKSK